MLYGGRCCSPPQAIIGVGGEEGIRTLGSFESLVFKTSSINHSDTSPTVTHHMITYLRVSVNSFTLVFWAVRLYPNTSMSLETDC